MSTHRNYRRLFGMMIRTAVALALMGFRASAVPAADDVTFIHIGDTHYNTRGENFEKQRERFRMVIEKMNALPGTP